MSGRSRAVQAIGVLGLLLALLPGRAAAQFGMPGRGVIGWSPQIGGRGGWLFKDDSPSLGAVLVLPVPVPILAPALTAGADVIFQDGLRERLATLDLTVNVIPGLFAGGGPALMDTYFGNATEREKKAGFSLVAGLGSGGGRSRVSTQIEIRKLFVDTRKPTTVVLQITYPLRALFGL